MIDLLRHKISLFTINDNKVESYQAGRNYFDFACVDYK